MRKSSLRLYAPFLAIALVQALFIAVAPSKPAGQQAQQVAAGSGLTGQQGRTTVTTGPGGTIVDAAGNVVSVGGGGTTGGGGGTTGGGGGDSGGGSESAAGDTSHCVGDRQFGLLNGNPPCVAKWQGGDNFGATYQGVTADSIKIVVFASEPNEQVDAILAQKGLAVPEDELAVFYDAAFGFIEKHYEFYGRKIEWKRITGNCPTTPPDYELCFAAANQVLQEKPFMVVWGTPLYADVFDVWAQNGIVAIGGWHFADRYFNDRVPYRYDVFMRGNESADHIAEYYCKKMAGKPADHAGATIHATIGGRNTPRHLGIVVPEIPANVETAQRVAAQVEACTGGADKPLIKTYESDINTAATQTAATVQALVANKVTTVTCMCDPIAPVFLTKGLTSNTYFPEWLMPGLGLLDYDILGQLYDPQQMAHAFGPSHLFEPYPLDDSDAARVWRDMGNSGHPCGKNGCNLQWGYAALVAAGLQMAGPNLTPQSFYDAMVTRGALNNGDWASKGGDPHLTEILFGDGDYTALSDAREVYWDANAVSPVDGSRGAFVALNNGQRYRLGGWPAGGLEGIPVR